jgi:hypothetical protein
MALMSWTRPVEAHGKHPESNLGYLFDSKMIALRLGFLKVELGALDFSDKLANLHGQGMLEGSMQAGKTHRYRLWLIDWIGLTHRSSPPRSDILKDGRLNLGGCSRKGANSRLDYNQTPATYHRVAVCLQNNRIPYINQGLI